VWEQSAANLARDFHVLAVDLPGFGASPADPDGWTAFAEHLRNLIDARSLSGAVLVGWSMGGLVVLDYLERFGSHALAGIVIVDVAPRAREDDDWPVGVAVGRGFGEGLDRWIQLWPDGREGIFHELNTLAFADPDRHVREIDWLVAEAMRADPDAAIEALVGFAKRDFRPGLGSIEVPALLLFGGSSTSTTAWVARYMKEAIPRSTLVTFVHCGHALMLEAPERFTRELRTFASTL
jgi:pimeloyl-ACP methyl ester carboxylesterase